MKIKVTLEESINNSDIAIEEAGVYAVIDKEQLHYFQDKTIDYAKDKHGFSEFTFLEE